MDFKKRPTYLSANVEIVSSKNVASGYCGLDSNVKVAAPYLYFPQIQLIGTSTSATPVVLTTDGGAASAANQLTLANDTTMTFRAQIVARNTATDTDSMGFEVAGVIRRGTSAANTSLIGTPTKTTLGTDGSAWTFAVTADTTNGSLKVTVTGASSKNIMWVCNIEYTGVTG